MLKERLSKRTPNIEELINSKNPIFQQWQASIRD